MGQSPGGGAGCNRFRRVRTVESSLAQWLQVFDLPLEPDTEKSLNSVTSLSIPHFLHSLVRISPVCPDLDLAIQGKSKFNCMLDILHS